MTGLYLSERIKYIYLYACLLLGNKEKTVKNLAALSSIIVSLSILIGCASLPNKREYRKDILIGDFNQAEEIWNNHNAPNDKLLKDLQIATIKQLKTEYDSSNAVFEQAKKDAARLSAISISESVAAVTVNQRYSEFSGNRFERIMIYFNKALNYIGLEDYSAARIEISQVGNLMREWGIDASQFPFISLFLGLIYEKLGDEENALVAYRRAVGLYRGEEEMPDILKWSYVNLLAKNGRNSELSRAEKALKIEAKPNIARLVMIKGGGVMTPLGSFTIYHHHPELKHNFLIALPFYPDNIYAPPPPQVAIDGRTLAPTDFDLVVNVEQEMRKALDNAMAGIISLALARAVIKKQLEQASDDKNLQLLVFFTNTITEVADTRSWDTLPQAFYFSNIAIEPGDHRVDHQGVAEMINLESGINFLYLRNR